MSGRYVFFTFGLALLALLVIPGIAHAKSGDPNDIVTLPWDNPAKKPIPPSFILPQQNRWGCLACHSNKKLSKFRQGREVSLYVDPEVIGNSMHKKIACIDCHTNFSYEDHPADSPKDFRKVAGLACMKCHPYQAYVYKQSVHGELALQDKKGRLAGKAADPALCSSCHGFHDIQSPRFEPYRLKFRLSGGRQVCGKCHTDRYESYGDYYHGQAYKNRAKDAPVCWDCHSNHKIVRAANRDSTIRRKNLPQTCGQCHDGPTAVLTSYAPLIHNRPKSLGNNPIYKIISSILPLRPEKAVAPEPDESMRELEIIPEPRQQGFLDRVVDFLFPKSLRPLRSE